MIRYIIKIDKKLKRYIKDVKEFKKILHNNDAYIAGGFLLSAIKDNSFETSDIDIYVSALNFNSLFEELTQIAGCTVDTDIRPLNNCNVDNEIKCANLSDEKFNCSFVLASEYDEAPCP